MDLPVLVNARWETPGGHLVLITTHPTPGHVGVAVIDGDTLLTILPWEGSAESAAQRCDRVYTRISIIIPIVDFMDLAGLNWLANEESMHALNTLTMPQRSMS